MNLPIYIVSLKRDIERRNKINDVFHRLNINFDFFNTTQEEKVEEDTKIVESFDDFVLNIKKNPEQEVCYKSFDHPVYFGKTFEYLKT